MSYLDTTADGRRGLATSSTLLCGLSFGGAIVIMYFVIAYDLWPHLTGRPIVTLLLMRTQLWLWFIGIIVTTFSWHYVGILGMPRRMAFYDYTDPAIADQAVPVIMSAFGGLILVISALLFFVVLIRGHRSPLGDMGEYRFSVAVHPPVRVPVALNTHALWVLLMIGLTITNYSFPILRCAILLVG